MDDVDERVPEELVIVQKLNAMCVKTDFSHAVSTDMIG